MTSPPEVTHLEEMSSTVVHHPNVVRSCDVVDDIPQTQTAKKMLNKFKALESQLVHNQSNASLRENSSQITTMNITMPLLREFPILVSSCPFFRFWIRGNKKE